MLGIYVEYYNCFALSVTEWKHMRSSDALPLSATARQATVKAEGFQLLWLFGQKTTLSLVDTPSGHSPQVTPNVVVLLLLLLLQVVLLCLLSCHHQAPRWGRGHAHKQTAATPPDCSPMLGLQQQLTPDAGLQLPLRPRSYWPVSQSAHTTIF